MKSPRQLIDRRVPAKQAWQECESLLQIQVVTASAAFMDEYPEVALLHAIPNGDWRGPRVAQKLKAEGVLPGIPDLCLPVPRGGYHGMYLELKCAGGTVKPDQWRIMQELHAHGYFVILTNCYHVAMKAIEEYVSCRVMRFEEEGNETNAGTDASEKNL